MLLIGERVDDMQPLRGGGELLKDALRERADDDGVDPALEIARDVADRLAPAERDVRLERDEMAAELTNGDLEGRPRAQRRLVEQHADVAAVQHVRRRRAASEQAVGLHLRRDLQAALEIDGVEVEDGQEVFARLRRWAHNLCVLCILCVPVRFCNQH